MTFGSDEKKLTRRQLDVMRRIDQGRGEWMPVPESVDAACANRLQNRGFAASVYDRLKFGRVYWLTESGKILLRQEMRKAAGDGESLEG